jgi:N-acetylmuramoyl-L-alanine amidase
MKIWLDAGHGGADPGALGNGLREKDVNLSVALKLGELLKNAGHEVGQTRTEDVFVGLSERARMANKRGADLFVSIHCDAVNYPEAHGTGTFIYNFDSKARGTAYITVEKISERLGIFNRFVKSANYAVLRETDMPAFLVELAFITNPANAALLRDRRADFAKALFEGITGESPFEELPAPPELVTPNDIAWELGRRQIATDADGLKAEMEANPDGRLYWLARKLLAAFAAKGFAGVFGGDGGGYSDPNDIVWDLNHRGLVSDWEGLLDETRKEPNGRLYWLARKGLQYLRERE